MKKSIMMRTAMMIAVVSLVSAQVFAADAKASTAAAKPAVTKTVAKAAPAVSIKVPVLNVSKYGEKAAGSFMVTWTDTSKGAYTYTLERAEADKTGKLSSAFVPVTAAKSADGVYTASDTVAAEKYFKYRLSAVEGKSTVNGPLSAIESSVTAPATATTASAATTAATTAAK
jgi:hypothetical protein